MKYRFKQAETEREFAGIARLNHAVFAAELGQHAPGTAPALVDKFHAKNTYFIAFDQERLIGMISVHFDAPFSVGEKLADPSVLDRLGRIAEIRLLAIEPAHRKGGALQGLLFYAYHHSSDRDTLVVSARQEELKMYRNLGFVELGPAVASGSAMFIPMAIPIPELADHAAKWERRLMRGSSVA